MVFFFQAEDGIRDLVRSRGLGDVYKRQDEGKTLVLLSEHGRFKARLEGPVSGNILLRQAQPVSYTHLTLPTSDLV